MTPTDHVRIEAFTPTIHDSELTDLRDRLRATRWPEPPTHPRQGVRLDHLQQRCAHWADGYDWRAAERRLNAVGQYRTEIDGLSIHFLHARSPRPDAFPLILTHGWPGSVAEYLDVIPLLTAAGFDCVVPSLPGYGWSGKPAQPGWGVERIAAGWATLMARLGYERYGAQGTDWGTSVSACLGRVDRDHVAGILLMPPLVPSATPGQGSDDVGYSAQHRTRPQTVAYALTDSPAGLAAWIGEKLDTWSDPRTPIPEDRILDTLMLYWLPRTAASSARLYWESLDDVTHWLTGPLVPEDRIDAPTGCVVFPHELQQPTRAEASVRFPDLRYWSRPRVGGHFPAMEAPETFAAEVTSCFSRLRRR